MTFITTGLTEMMVGLGPGVTRHYQFSYEDSLQQTAANPTGPEPARTNLVIANCENDYEIMKNWFGGIELNPTVTTPIPIQVANASGGANVGGPWPHISCRLNPGSANSDFCRSLLIAEITEMFMAAQGRGWYAPDRSNEQSTGEGLSHFLTQQFQIRTGMSIDTAFTGNGNLWLNTASFVWNGVTYGPRADFVNTTLEYDHNNDPSSGCAVLFIYYLKTQLGFDINSIIANAAPTLAGVYRNLTGDTGNPFPFFKQLLDSSFPPTATASIPGPNPDNPWPLARLSFVVDKSSFGHDEVTDALNSPPPNTGRFPNAFWLVLEGFNQQVLGSTTPILSVPADLTHAGITMPPAGPAEYERPGDQLAPQRIRFPYNISFSEASLNVFPSSGNPPVEKPLNASITVLGKTFNASTVLEFVAGADPYFTNVDPTQNNVFYLSQDLRVFTATPGLNHKPVPEMPVPGIDGPSFDTSAYDYIQSLLGFLNGQYRDPTGVDPFDPMSHVIPGQTGAYTGDSSVTPSTNVGGTAHANYNFAVARVRLRGSPDSPPARDVRVFFRLFVAQSCDTDFQPDTTYRSRPGTGAEANLPVFPLASGDQTVLFFATDASGTHDYDSTVTNANIRTIPIPAGQHSVWAYFGCFLDVYDSSHNAMFPGTHHCIVAQIAYDGAPIPTTTPSGVTPSPENSDKLAQRNLQVTSSSNPGVPATHLIPQTFDLRPSLPIILDVLDEDTLLQYPDELMIDWGNTPLGSTASIYLPQVNVLEVLHLASRLYASHSLFAADANTIKCEVIRGVTYVPIPSGLGENFAGLLTIELPPTVVKGQQFDVVIRRITTRRFQEKPPIQIGFGAKPIPRHRRKDKAGDSKQEINWRYVVGTFQVKIPVSTADVILPAEENTLAILKWRLQAMSPKNRWYPVLQRYVSYIAARVEGLGGDPDAIPPSLSGAPLVLMSDEETNAIMELQLALHELQEISSLKVTRRKTEELEHISSYSEAVERVLQQMGLNTDALKAEFRTIATQTDAQLRKQELQVFYTRYGPSFEQAFDQAGVDRAEIQARLLAHSGSGDTTNKVWQGLALGLRPRGAMQVTPPEKEE